jgi:hypothetical protein
MYAGAMAARPLFAAGVDFHGGCGRRCPCQWRVDCPHPTGYDGLRGASSREQLHLPSVRLQ